MNIFVTSLPDIKKIHPQRYHHLLQYLSERHNVTVLCVNAWWLEEKRDKYIERLIENIDFHYLTDKKIHPVFQELMSFRSRGLKKTSLMGFDLHLNLNSLLFGYFASRKVKSLGLPTVFDICDDVPEWIGMSPQIPHLLRNFGKIVGGMLLRKNFELADKITCVTRSLFDSYNFPQAKSVIVPNGVDVRAFQSVVNGTSREKLKLKDEFVVGFVGALNQWIDLKQGFGALKDLVEKDIDIKLLVVGDGEKLGLYKTLAKKLDLVDKVLFTGGVNYDQVSKYISCMDVGLICRKPTKDSQNSLPLKLFEYMACAKPVVSTPLSGVVDAVGDRILYARDSRELAKEIQELYHNADLRTELGRNGREFVDRNYNWDNICDRFEKVIIEANENR